MRFNLLLLSLGICFALSGCDSSSSADHGKADLDSGIDGAGARAAPVADTRDVLSAECAYLARCVPRALLVFPGATLESCVEYALADFQGPGSEPAFYADPDACLAWLRQSQCDLPLLWVNFGTNAGLQGLASGGVLPYRGKPPGCEVGSESTFARKPRAAAVGEACLGNEGACVDEAFCRNDHPIRQRGDTWCGVCEPRAKQGERCSNEDRPCDFDTFCDGSVCRSRLSLGARCENHWQCIDFTCEDGACAPNTNWSLPVLDGASLSAPCTDTDRLRCNRDLTLACVAGQCTPRADVGEACDSVDDCRLGLSCLAGACSTEPAPQPNLDACGELERCPDGTFCDWRAGVCLPPGQEGEDCSPRCAEGLTCERCAGVCIRPLARGGKCHDDFDCMEGVCAFDLSGCQVRGYSFQCSYSVCEQAGACVPRAQAQDCDG